MVTNQRIVEALKRVEQVEGVRILHAVESGSRVWGFESTDSDYDIRFIYLRPLSWYLGVGTRRDVLEYAETHDKLDISGWDIRKACQLMYKSNPPLMEWLTSPKVYWTSSDIWPLQKLMTDFFNPRAAVYHYLSMAKTNYRTYLKTDLVRIKKYFYVLRPLFAVEWIMSRNHMAPLEFEQLWTAAEPPLDVNQCINALLQQKRAGIEVGMGRRIDVINAYIEDRLHHWEQNARLATVPEVSREPLDQYFCHVAMGKELLG